MTLWEGRLPGEPDPLLWSYTVDPADHRLLPYDVAGSIAHAEMLAAVGLIEQETAERLLEGLERIRGEAEAGTFRFLPGDEDVHSAVERRLSELVGWVAGMLPTARSRNDQVALDLRLYLIDQVGRLRAGLEDLADRVVDVAEAQAETLVPSHTHLQQAQVISLGHQLLAHAWGRVRDSDRFDDLGRRLGSSPLGAGAGGGSSLPIDPARVATRLGLEAVFENSVDAVASRDLAAEFVFCCAQAMVGLSRLAEEVVLWASSEFGWVRLPDRLSTGSSVLPQKKNPDPAELARGRAAAVIGDLTTLLVLQKGLPLSYHRDLQEDKPPIFHAADTLGATLRVLGEMLAGAVFGPPPPGSEAGALDLAEALVRRGVPFREAHRVVGALVAEMSGRNRRLGEVTAAELAATHPSFRSEDLALLDPAASAAARVSPGGGSPQSVREQAAALRKRLRP